MSLAKKKQMKNIATKAASALISRARSSIRWSSRGALLASISASVIRRLCDRRFSSRPLARTARAPAKSVRHCRAASRRGPARAASPFGAAPISALSASAKACISASIPLSGAMVLHLASAPAHPHAARHRPPLPRPPSERDRFDRGVVRAPERSARPPASAPSTASLSSALMSATGLNGHIHLGALGEL